MAMHRVSGLRLEADIPLPELPRASAARADCRFQLLPPRRRAAAPRAWLHRWRRDDGGVLVSLGRTGRDYLVRFTGLADFLISREADLVRCRARPEVSPATVRHLLLDQVIPMVLAHRGRLALHASAAIAGDGALAFAGKAGWGKSTICASLAHAGGSPLADDCLVIGGRRGRYFAVPSYPGLRLWPDTVKALGRRVRPGALVADYSEKRRITSQRADIRRRAPVPLRAIYVLSPPRRRRVISIARIEPREAVGRLLAHTHRLDLTDRSRLVAELEALSRLAARVPVFELAFPRDLERLAALRAAVLRHAGGLP
jgi:hypothetical protein